MSSDNAKPDLVLTGPALPSCLATMQEHFNVANLFECKDDAARDAFFKAHAETRFVTVFGHYTKLDAEFLARLPKLEMISNFAVGTDAIDLVECKRRGIRVTNTPDVLNDAVAELTLALMLAVCRQVVPCDKFVRAGKWPAGGFGLTQSLTGKTVGILGLGRIGKEIANRCAAFKMQVVYCGRTKQPMVPYPYYDDVTTMAKAVDWLVCVVPGTPATTNLITRDVLTALGPKGYFVNVGRGTLVDEAALIDMLAAGELGGAGLDVFAKEPQMDPRMWELDNVVLQPHQGSATEDTRYGMGQLVVNNLLCHLRGDPLITPVV